jgi:hypothetical protein
MRDAGSGWDYEDMEWDWICSTKSREEFGLEGIDRYNAAGEWDYEGMDRDLNLFGEEWAKIALGIRSQGVYVYDTRHGMFLRMKYDETLEN